MPPDSTDGRATDQRGTAPTQRATAATGAQGQWGSPGGVDPGGQWDAYGNYWYADDTGRGWVWREPQKRWELLSTPANAIQVEGRFPMRLHPYNAFHAGVGTGFGQQHGLVSGIQVVPLGIAEAWALDKGSQLASHAPGWLGLGAHLVHELIKPVHEEMEGTVQQWQAEAKQRDRELEIMRAEERGDSYRLPVVIQSTTPRISGAPTPGLPGTRQRPNAQGFIDQLAATYRSEIAKAKVRYPDADPMQIGRMGEKATLEQVPALARANGLDPEHIWVGNFPVGVTGPKGGAVTAEAGSQHYGFIVELKKSPLAVRGYQAEAHEVAVGAAVNFERGGTYYRMYGEGYEEAGKPAVESYEIGEEVQVQGRRR